MPSPERDRHEAVRADDSSGASRPMSWQTTSRRVESVSHVIAVGTPPSWSPEDLATKSESFFEADASDARKQVLRDNLAKLSRGASPGQRMLACSRAPHRSFYLGRGGSGR